MAGDGEGPWTTDVQVGPNHSGECRPLAMSPHTGLLTAHMSFCDQLYTACTMAPQSQDNCFGSGVATCCSAHEMSQKGVGLGYLLPPLSFFKPPCRLAGLGWSCSCTYYKADTLLVICSKRVSDSDSCHRWCFSCWQCAE
jgi:hypothetical protein